jgi:hypothetical protein
MLVVAHGANFLVNRPLLLQGREPAPWISRLTADRALPALREPAVPRTDCALTSMVFVADRPHCPSCGEPMWLVRVVETGPHLSERRFECACCDAKDVRVEPH